MNPVVRRYTVAVIAFLLGGSNTIFGTHFTPEVIAGDFVLAIMLLIAETVAIHKKDWKTAISDLQQLGPVIAEIVKQFMAQMPSHASNTPDQQPTKKA